MWGNPLWERSHTAVTPMAGRTRSDQVAQTRSNPESAPGIPGGTAGRTTSADAPADAPLGPWAVAWRHAIGTTDPAAWVAKADQGLTDDGPRQGLPLGGLGTGSIGRDHDGRFVRWHLTPGHARYQPAAGSWIALETAGSGGPAALLPGGTPTRPAGLADAMPAQPGTYEALFPVARSRYQDGAPADGLETTVTQWSPVVKGEESTSAWPAGYLQVTLRSVTTEPRDVTVAMAFELPVDDPLFHQPAATDTVTYQAPPATDTRATAVARLLEAEASFALAVESPTADAEVAASLLAGDGDYDRLRGGLWEGLHGQPAPAAAAVANRPGLAAAARVRLAPGETLTVTFVLTWDLPRIRFGPRLETAWWRAHTREFGRTGVAAGEIAATALDRRTELAARVDAWHGSLAAWLAEVDAPPWLLAAALNELYVLVEGGTAWVAGPAEGVGPRPGGPLADGTDEEHFGVLESVDYKFYETLDVRYYSSFALMELWPRLERVVIRDFADSVTHEDPEPVTIEWTGAQSIRTRAGAVPHDLGGPGGAPFRSANHYLLQDANQWKDLNAKLVLEAVRDALLLRDDDLARSVWPACRQALRYLETFDRDGDGVPENDGVPDQTYDTWTMSGVSAYCSDLWLAALTAGAWLAGKAGDDAEAWRLTVLRDRAAAVVERALWRGDCYRFDNSGGANSEDILADQFAGTWYLRVLGLDVTHPPERVVTGLDTVLARNLDGFCGGTRGPVNGRGADGGPVDSGGEQPDEVWVGVAWGLASLCLLEGRDADAWRIGKALHDTLYTDSGLWFRTPEAWTADGEFRAPLYHRPLAVWSLITALRTRTRTASAVLQPAEPLGG